MCAGRFDEVSEQNTKLETRHDAQAIAGSRDALRMHRGDHNSAKKSDEGMDKSNVR